MKSIERASELMVMKMKDIPTPALNYARFLSEKFGLRGEVLVTAYAHFAECYEGAEKSDGYLANDEARAFFDDYLLLNQESKKENRT